MTDLEEYTLEELQEAEEDITNKLIGLSKHASQNKPQIERLSEKLKILSPAIDAAQAQQVRLQQQEKQPQIEALRAQQNALGVKIAGYAKQPSKYAAKIAELGRQARAIDEQIEEATNG